MDSKTAVGVAPPTLIKLIQHFAERQQDVDLSEALTRIVDQWLADQAQGAGFPALQGQHEPGPQETPRGYHWKALFLPHGTRLGFVLGGPDEFAVVIGDRLMYQGLPTTPNQFVGRFRHLPCNAWELLAVLFPGEREWVRAKLLRRNQADPRDRRPMPRPRSARPTFEAQQCRGSARVHRPTPPPPPPPCPGRPAPATQRTANV